MMIMGSRFLQLLPAFMGLLCMGTNGYGLGGANSKVQCKDNERQALLNIKQGFRSPSNRFSSWTAEGDCCKWRGVKCNDTTGHIITLDLRSPRPSELFYGELDSFLLDLPYLSHLDLSLNDFRQVPIPEFIGNLSNLKFLNLSSANFKGTVPYHLGNLSRLESLDLSGNSFNLQANNLDWLYGLSSLKVLNLNSVFVSNAVNWLNAVNMLPSLLELRLSACALNNLPPSLPYVNFTSLEILDLSVNNFESPHIPQWLFNISQSLVYLNLRKTQLCGPIPSAFRDMTSLIFLDLSENNLEGGVPTLGLIHERNQLKRQSALRELRLSHNQLNGSLEQSLAQFSDLVVLDVAANSLVGVITEAQLLNFSSLKVLNLSWNSIVLNLSSTWIPAFQLDIIGLQSCQLGPHFPEWLRTHKNFSSIDISDANISDTVPDWFWNLSSTIKYVNLSYNQLRGKVPDFSLTLNLLTLDLSYNEFEGPLPHFSPNIRSLVLAGNSFSGPVSHLCEILVANNSLSYLDLSSNLLSGQLPDCWTSGQNLVILTLSANNLTGKIPDSIGHLNHLNTLRLNNNSLSGELPLSLKNLTGLFVLDFGENRLCGKLPAWIGERLLNLQILRLHSNAFDGNISPQLCQLKSLKILDLALNRISGPIPRCIHNFAAMAERDNARSYIYYPYTAYQERLLVTWKGRSFIYSRTLFLVKILDLSSNNLSGEIPRELTRLVGLFGLNLSNNHLTGIIPQGIAALTDLESLDLSGNHLSCSVPTSMTDLVFLMVLNLSHNNLSGEIPRSLQFDTFENSSYMGNPHLCGPPLTNDCSGDESNDDPYCSNNDGDYIKQGTREEGGNGIKIPSFYISMGLGFITGFWGFWIPLLFYPSWRYAYYRFLGDMYDKIYVIVAVRVAKLRRNFQSQQQLVEPKIKRQEGGGVRRHL